MNQKALRTLEFNKIIEILAQMATSEKGRQLCLSLSPVSDIEEIERLQSETKAALDRILRTSTPDFSGTHDPSEIVKRLEIGATLNTTELLRVSSLLRVASRIKSYGKPRRDDEADDVLSEDFRNLEPLTPVREEIDRCIISEEEISDDASPGLKNVRRQIKITGDRVRSKMNEMLNSATVRDCLQDSVITMRGGRYCLPVRAEFKSRVPGMVHDQSGSGATLFIEPMAVVNLNNELRELEAQEKDEIQKVLIELGEKVAEYSEEIVSDFNILTELDFIFARGRLAANQNASRPLFKRDGIVNLRRARHPLIDSTKVVPIDIRLGDEFSLLIITGPNTGGKTVSLKTLGLLSLMGQSGLHIPAGDRSKLPVFDEVFADIGDEQSIEQSLSTFSSHMTNIINIISQIESYGGQKRCLALFDELCAGTDPTEGAALAIAILDRLRTGGALTMATTHYSEIKVYALQTPDVENASCEFNVETLSPTYRLLIGVPGRSNAFSISEKLGLPKEIISDAKSRMDEGDRSMEDLMADLETKRAGLESRREEMDKEKESLLALQQKIKNQRTQIEKQKEEILSKANEKATNILKDAKDTADAAIRNIHKYGDATPDMSKLEKQRANLGKKLKGTRGKSIKDIKPTRKAKKIDPSKLRVGDEVNVLSMNLKGIIQSLPGDKGELEVQMGILRSRVKLDDIELIEEPSVTDSGKAGKTARRSMGGFNKAASISPEIKLLGMTGDEAIIALDKYLDDAYLAHLSSVRIVHGKGSGILRKVVSDYLRKQRIVKSYHLAEYGEGDSGVTIAEFVD